MVKRASAVTWMPDRSCFRNPGLLNLYRISTDGQVSRAVESTFIRVDGAAGLRFGVCDDDRSIGKHRAAGIGDGAGDAAEAGLRQARKRTDEADKEKHRDVL